MSRADWSFLEHLLEEGQEYSTAVGRVWLTVLFLFRMLVLGTAAESAWDDEQDDFTCDTRQPGCTAVCYDRAFPISHFRYFVLQVIFVSTPTIFYFAYVAVRAGKDRRTEEAKDGKQAEEGNGRSKKGDIVKERLDTKVIEEKAEEKEKEKKGRKTDKPPPEAPKLKGRLLCAYAFSILLKVLLEVGFIVGLWFLYNGFFIEAKFECRGFPCPHIVDCYVSRPTEKTIFTIYTQVIAAVSLLLNVIELFHLLQLAVSHRLEKRYRAERLDYLPRAEQEPARRQTPELQAEVSEPYKAGSHVQLPSQGEAVGYSNPCESYGDAAIEVNWGPGESGTDLLPSYVNCMGAMRTTHSPRIHYKKHAHHTGKNPKSVHKGHSKQKHYV
ncbi:gap junction alpha-4 protein-like [Stegastes partitus]|uniref:Gap junction protein n=1 Tax=Stegastes partitus TaxID=144197 RepID=A0A3B4ZI14_9TELE|nr:PREDICTED: gap junction alpha-4 protein [Stegastes partitus]XP_008293309.1 PREDICTED: gap junction alpha-4 protein-like [Stegastes partitus]XP_008293310.1 PREDICTED: gap junction alpha-4 protein-like [Stegastes partitus]